MHHFLQRSQWMYSGGSEVKSMWHAGLKLLQSLQGAYITHKTCL